jgi:hypothetical protein
MIISPIQAERQFKLDFYEFYSLLERALVCLFGVWGIMISSSAGPTTNTTATNHSSKSGTSFQTSCGVGTILGDSRAFHGMSHRFHANVLDALDHPSNPLHEVLGTGETRMYIGVAKEFRNKWKDVDLRPDDSFYGHERVEEEWDPRKVRRYEKVLIDLNLEALLGAVLAGLEEAGRRAELEIQRFGAVLGDGPGGKVHVDENDFDMQDAPFEVGGDRMDFDHEMQL